MHIEFSRQGAKDRNELYGGHAHTYFYAGKENRYESAENSGYAQSRRWNCNVFVFVVLWFYYIAFMHIKCSLVHRPLHSLVHYI